jgi:endonuclease/exonuclease/phosphatase family metal-dependent hydrolase
MYESYPQKHENLDYILLPNEFIFKKFKCENLEISDHCPIYCELYI